MKGSVFYEKVAQRLNGGQQKPQFLIKRCVKMKNLRNSATYYLLAVIILNLFFAYPLKMIAEWMPKALRVLCFNDYVLSHWLTQAWWWPRVVAGLAFAVLLILLTTCRFNTIARHFLILLFFAELWLMFLSALAYTIPFVPGGTLTGLRTYADFYDGKTNIFHEENRNSGNTTIQSTERGEPRR